MKITVELSPKRGLHISSDIPPTALKVLIPLLTGALTWPWLLHLAQAMGWM